MDMQLQKSKQQESLKIKMNKDIKPEQKPFDHILAMDNPSLLVLSKETLNSLVAYCSMEEIKEEDKPCPDKNSLERLDAFSREVIAVDRNHENFSDKDRMRDIVRKYCPMLKKLIWVRNLSPNLVYAIFSKAILNI